MCAYIYNYGCVKNLKDHTVSAFACHLGGNSLTIISDRLEAIKKLKPPTRDIP